MTHAKKDRYSMAIKNLLVALAANDKLPLDMNELDHSVFYPAFDETKEDKTDAILEKMGQYLSEGYDDPKVITVLRKLKKTNPNDSLENVDELTVWEKVEGSFTVFEFCELVGI